MGRRRTLSFRVDEETFAEVRGCVRRIEEEEDMGFSREVLLRRGLELVLADMRAKFNEGRPFPPHSDRLRTGQRRGPLWMD